MSKKKGSGWMKRHVQDSFVKLAKQDGNVSRAVYKLQEIDKKHHIINPKAPQTILELGAAPGSWTSYVVDRLAPESTLIAVDLLPLDPVVLQKLQMRRGDIQSYILQGDLISHDIQSSLFGKNVSVVLSDMAVNTCGDRATDALRTMGLVDSAFQLAGTTLADGGSFVCKYFSCADEQDLKK
jgi:23S rRNA (uridine2552-2'-O)-methyltransferase